MASTHALTLAGVADDHWLRSDLWLPNGWATVVFVMLSGYGVGYVFSVREPVGSRDARLYRRGWQILAVMFFSNLFFVGLRSVLDGDTADFATLAWWWGFIDLETPWSLSGVLLPTALVMLLGPLLIRAVAASAWRALAVLFTLKVVVSMTAVALQVSLSATAWWARLLFLEGLGGFPVLPFLLNGCAGAWLGMQWHRSQTVWLRTMAIFLVLQLASYASTFANPSPAWSLWREIFGATGKFAWVFLVASALAKPRYRGFAKPLTLLGHFGLGSFVWHRVVLQALSMALAGTMAWSDFTPDAGMRYAVLFAGTLLLTWAGCDIVMARRMRDAIRAEKPAPTSAETYITR